MAGLVFQYEGDVTVDASVEFDPHDLSLYRQIGGFVQLTGNASGGGGTLLDVYLESRDFSGVWQPRWHATQFVGTGLEGVQANLYALMQQTAFTNAAQNGLSSAALAAGEVLNGAFPPMFYESQVNPGGQSPADMPAPSWRVRFDQTNAGTFPLKICFWAIGPYISGFE